MCRGSVRGLWATHYLPWSFLSVREAKVFTCLLPYLLEYQVKGQKIWPFWSSIVFQKSSLPFDDEQCCPEVDRPLCLLEEKSGNGGNIFFFCQFCNQESKFLFFRGQVTYSNGSGSSLPSLAVYAVSLASGTHRAFLINPMKLSVPCWSLISMSSQRSRCCMKAQAYHSGCTVLSLVLVFLLQST